MRQTLHVPIVVLFMALMALSTNAFATAGTLVSQAAVDNYVEVRSQPNLYYYNYAPDVVYSNGMYHMYWCAGVGGAGDYILHAQSVYSWGPFHASNNAANFSYDVALEPTWNSANFDGYEACDPSVMQVGSTYYLYYGGNATQSNATASTKIGVATSSDGIHFSRAHAGQPIVTPVHWVSGNYGAGQPAVFYITPYYYMSFTDSTGSGGNGQYMIRALDPYFQQGTQELTGVGIWTDRSAGTRSGQYMYLAAFSVDIAYDAMTGNILIASDQLQGQNWVYIINATTFANYGHLAMSGTWADGASILKNTDRTLLKRTSCDSLDLQIYKGDSPTAQYTDVRTWNISRSEAKFTLDAAVCDTPMTRELNSAVFNPSWYLQHYADLRAAFGTNTDAATKHWLNAGIKEGRQGSLTFSSQQYLAMNGDLIKAFGSTGYAAAIQHYIQSGKKEGRVGLYALRAEVFSSTWYLQNHADLVAAFGTDLSAATTHWLNNGIGEGRRASSTFSSVDYLKRYADLSAAFGAKNYSAAIQHYILHGIPEHRDGQ